MTEMKVAYSVFKEVDWTRYREVLSDSCTVTNIAFLVDFERALNKKNNAGSKECDIQRIWPGRTRVNWLTNELNEMKAQANKMRRNMQNHRGDLERWTVPRGRTQGIS